MNQAVYRSVRIHKYIPQVNENACSMYVFEGGSSGLKTTTSNLVYHAKILMELSLHQCQYARLIATNHMKLE